MILRITYYGLSWKVLDPCGSMWPMPIPIKLEPFASMFFLPRLHSLGGSCPEANGDTAQTCVKTTCAPDTFIHDEQASRNKLSRTIADKGLLQFQWNRVLAHKCSAGSHQLAVRVQFLEDHAHLLIHVALAEAAAAAVVAIETVTTVVAEMEL